MARRASGCSGRVETRHQGVSPVRDEQTEKQLDQGAFARAIGAKQPRAARSYGEGDSVKRLHLAIALAEIRRLDDDGLLLSELDRWGDDLLHVAIVGARRAGVKSGVSSLGHCPGSNGHRQDVVSIERHANGRAVYGTT